MGLLDRLRRLRAANDGPDPRLGAVLIADTPLRRPTALAGQVVDIHIVFRSGSPSLELELRDPSGDALVVFTGRQSIPGISPGRDLFVEGVARREGDRIVLLNPGYRLL